MDKKNKTRTWLLYVVIVIFVAALGFLAYRLIDGSSKEDGGGFFQSFFSEFEETEKEIKKRTTSFSDAWAGTHSYAVAQWVATDAITHNKKYTDEPVQVTINGVDCGTDVDCITEQKKNITEGDYEISFEYEDGYVYLIKLEKI